MAANRTIWIAVVFEAPINPDIQNLGFLLFLNEEQPLMALAVLASKSLQKPGLDQPINHPNVPIPQKPVLDSVA